MEDQLKKLSVNDNAQGAQQPKPRLGGVPLAEKIPCNSKGTNVNVATNIRQITLRENQPIFKYAVEIIYFYADKNGVEKGIEMSKSIGSGTEHAMDKERCQKVYYAAIEKHQQLRKPGTEYFYDRQASLYTTKKLENEIIGFVVADGISKRSNFVKAHFSLRKVDEKYQVSTNDVAITVNPRPSNADKTLLEALSLMLSGPAFKNPRVITIGNCVHYLDNTSGLGIRDQNYQEGQLSSGVGVSKSVKTLEGSNPKKPVICMTTEMKTTLFHPDSMPLIDLLRTFNNFTTTLKPNSFQAQRMEKACRGMELFLDYGNNKDLGDESMVVKIRKFWTSARDTSFKTDDGKTTTVMNYFKQVYNITLKYPDLFTVEVKGKKGGKMHLPVEVLVVCKNQVVTNDQMINNEQSDLIRTSAAPPHVRKATTDKVVSMVGLAGNEKNDLFAVARDPMQVTGILLEKPKIVFAGDRKAVLPDPSSKFPTDFKSVGKYFIAMSLTNWELVFIQGEEVPGLAKQLYDEMFKNGMRAEMPKISYIVRGDLESVFQAGKAANRQLLFFVVKSKNNFHQQIKALEQKYDVLTQEVRAETADKVFRQPQTRLNIINKTNMKLGGLNYKIDSESFRNPNRLIIGFETSQRAGGNPDYPISVGFAANMLDHFQKFSGGYVYVQRDKNVFGSMIKETLIKIFNALRKNNRQKTTEILLYFNGVSEGQFSLLNEDYSLIVKSACLTIPDFKPHFTILASSKMHNERLYKAINNGVANLEPGTIVDKTIVSPVLNEWFHAAAAARQGTTKTAKYTVIYTTKDKKAWTMEDLEKLTNDLCYDHQIVFHPVGLPVPLFIAGRYSQRGAMVLAANNGPIYKKDGEIDLEATNEKFGVSGKKLFNSRFNA